MSIINVVKNSLVAVEYLTHTRDMGSKILFYHDINDDSKHSAFTDMSTPLDLFVNHINLIRNEGFSITARITEPERQVMIVFDDGWKGIYENKETLLEAKLLPTICIAPGLLNHPGYLSDVQVKELYALGFGFVSHSWSHQSLTMFNGNKDSLQREMGDAKKFIEDLLSTEVSVLCFPNGLFSKAVYEATLNNGYKEAWSVIDGDYYNEVMPAVKRRCLVQFASQRELEMVLNGANRMLARKHYKSTYMK